MTRIGLSAFVLLFSACSLPDAGGPTDAAAEADAQTDPSVDAGGPTDAAIALDAQPDAAVDAGPSDAFTLLGHETAECPWAPEDCAEHWPSGTVLRFSSVERFGELTHARTFYMVIPEGLVGPAPVWIALHGGYGSGLRTIRTTQIDELAAGELVRWRRNEGDCRFDPYQTLAEFRDSGGEPCEPPVRSARATERVIAVFPEGVDVGGIRHWEDGRVPSPGFGTDEEQRDDVGFINHVVGTVLETEVAPIEAARIYLSGISNGGHMTLRVMCNQGRPGYEGLSAIAAYSANVAALAEGAARGLAGRQACLDRPTRALPGHYIAGRGFPTPGPEVDGDGFVPWGEPGRVFPNNSPQGGLLLGVEDTFALLGQRLLAEPVAEDSDPLGAFTTRHRITNDDGLESVLLETEGGHHRALGGRMDFLPVGREWDFLSRHRYADGQVTRQASTMEGEY